MRLQQVIHASVDECVFLLNYTVVWCFSALFLRGGLAQVTLKFVVIMLFPQQMH